MFNEHLANTSNEHMLQLICIVLRNVVVGFHEGFNALKTVLSVITIHFRFNFRLERMCNAVHVIQSNICQAHKK